MVRSFALAVRVSVLAVSVLAVSACASAGPFGGTGPDVQGRTFLSTSVTGHDLVAGTRISLSFPEKGKITANGGCNHLFGEVSFDGDRMAVSEMGSTDMACEKPLMAQDEWLTGFLKAKPKYSLSGNDFVLTGDGGTVIKLLDRKVANPDRPLLGTRWVVESLIDGESVSSVPRGGEAYLQFDGDTVTGNTGCNRLSGKAVHSPGKVVFSTIATTKMSCAGDVAMLEAAVLSTVSGEASVKIDADRLQLVNPDGKGLGLRSATEPSPRSS
jgi:heat shock protein HslJ